MMKKYIKYLIFILILPISLIFAGCSNSNEKTKLTLPVVEEVVSIKDIKLTGSNNMIDEYTITYTNGETDTFTIVNGEDGENLYSNITINDLYEQVKSSKPEGYDLLDFIDEYLDIEVDTNAVASSKALRSAVSIFVEHKIEIYDYNKLILNPNGYYEYGIKESIGLGAGAGVIYDLDTTTGDAYIITNYHVCFNSASKAEDGVGTRFTLYTYGAETMDMADWTYLKYYNGNCKEYGDLFEYDANGLPVIDYGYGAIDAEYVGGSEEYDIAVLKVSNSEVLKNSDCLEADVYNSDLVPAGSTGIAVGNPDAWGISVTNGVVSVDSEYIAVQISDSAVILREFRIDTPVNAGNSGGGLFDGRGRLIGIVNAKTSDTTIENMSYAIPSNIVARVAQSIIDNCDGTERKTTRAIVGVVLETVNSKGVYNKDTGLMSIVETVAIYSVQENSLASEIGLQIGDIINSIEIVKSSEIITITIDRSFKFTDAMLLVRKGDNIIINYTRDNVSTSVTTPILTEDYFIDVK